MRENSQMAPRCTEAASVHLASDEAAALPAPTADIVGRGAAESNTKEMWSYQCYLVVIWQITTLVTPHLFGVRCLYCSSTDTTVLYTPSPSASRQLRTYTSVTVSPHARGEPATDGDIGRGDGDVSTGSSARREHTQSSKDEGASRVCWPSRAPPPYKRHHSCLVVRVA